MDASSDFLVTCDTVIPDPSMAEASRIDQAAVHVRGDRIIAIGPREVLSRDLRAVAGVQQIDLGRRVLMPGLINAHGHAAMTLFRGLADDLPLLTWLQEHIWPAEGRFVGESFVRAGTALALVEMIRGGTTCFSDMYFFPEVTAALAEEAGMRCQIATPVLDFPTPWAANAEEYLARGVELARRWPVNSSRPGLISTAFGPHAPYTVSDAPLRRIVELSAEHGCPIQIHLHETAGEVERALAEDGRRPLQRLDELGLIGPRTQCVHMTAIDDSDVRTMATRGAHVVHCPHSNLKLASGFCPVETFRKAGINIALGTDGAASNNHLDMWEEMRSAALLAKAVAGDATALPAGAALYMATRAGANALGLGNLTGRLEPGLAADMIAVDLEQANTLPVHHLASQLVYALNARQVTDVWVAGRRLLAGGALQTLDEQSIYKEASQWQQKIAAA